MSEERKRFYRIKALGDTAHYIETEEGLSSVIDMLKDCEDGGGYSIKAVSMTQRVFDSAPEFTGF